MISTDQLSFRTPMGGKLSRLPPPGGATASYVCGARCRHFDVDVTAYIFRLETHTETEWKKERKGGREERLAVAVSVGRQRSRGAGVK